MSSLKVIASGVSGFIGQRLEKELLERSDVHLDRLSRTQAKAPNSFKFDPISLESLSKSYRYDSVINLAAFITNSPDDGDLSDYIAGNVLSTRLLLDFAIKNKAKQFIHISSFSIFDGLEGLQINEENVPAPVTLYSQSKLTAEHLVLSEQQSFERGVVIIRPAFTYGTGMRRNRMIPFFAERLLRSEPLHVYNPDAILQLSAVDDVVDAIKSSFTLEDSVTINAVNEQLSKIDMVRQLQFEIQSLSAITTESYEAAPKRAQNTISNKCYKKLLGRDPISFHKYISRQGNIKGFMG